MIFDTCFAYVVGEEGELSLDPQDPGNWTGGAQGVGELKGTKYGISAAVYPHLDIANLTTDQAKALYFADYWTEAHCDQYSDPVALMMFDTAVNEGVTLSKRILQEALGVHVDGMIGPGTLGALRLANIPALIQEFKDQRIVHYQRDSAWAHDGHGWVNRANATAAKAASLL